MGVFFKTAANTQTLKSALETALKIDPNTVKNSDQHASAMVAQVQGQTPKAQFSWGRLAVAVGMLALLGGLGIWSATIPSLDAWSKMFLHSFEILFGSVVGLLGVESATN
jgi:hypothetical protein